MAYNSRAIKVDVDGKPIPQYFDPLLDDFQPLFGSGGAARSVLYGPDGQPINSSNPLPTKDDALAALLGELNNAPVTDPSATSATVLELLRGLLAVAGRETTLAAVKAAIDELTARAATEETLSATRDALDSLAQRGLATEVTLAQAAQALATLAGTVDAGAQQVTLSGSLMQIIKEYKDVPYDQGNGLTGSLGALHFGENMHAEGGQVRYLDVAAYPHLDVLLYNGTDVDLLAGIRILPVPGIREIDYYGRGIFRNEVISNRQVKKGDYLWIRSIEEPQLNRVAAISAHFKIKDNVPTEGTLSVIFLGSRI